jgi:hypothetical protein
MYCVGFTNYHQFLPIVAVLDSAQRSGCRRQRPDDAAALQSNPLEANHVTSLIDFVCVAHLYSSSELQKRMHAAPLHHARCAILENFVIT